MQYYNLKNVDDLLLMMPMIMLPPTTTTTATIEDHIIRWLVSLREKVSYVTRHTYMAAILTFYEINDISLNKRKIARFLGQETTRRNKDRAYTIEETRKLLEHAVSR